MRCSRSSALTITVAASLSAGLVATPAAAVQATARCTFDYEPRITPGLLASEASSGIVSSGGETGTVDCAGTIDGAQITGPGSYGFEGTYSDADCLNGGHGAGRLLFTLPTTAGDRHVEEPMTYAFGPAAAYPSGVGGWDGSRTSGAFAVVPVEGDCVTAPVTLARGTGRFTLA